MLSDSIIRSFNSRICSILFNTSGAFDVRRLDGTKISAGISYKKLSLLEKRKMFLTELRKEGRDSSRV